MCSSVFFFHFLVIMFISIIAFLQIIEFSNIVVIFSQAKWKESGAGCSFSE